MLICGFQKLTLLDYPDHLAALVFTGGCNFRCPWCQNGSLIVPGTDTPFLNENDVFRQLERRAGMLEGVVITGGEPTLQPDLRSFIVRCRNAGFKVKLDTNGSRPDVLIPLAEDGLLDYVAMDVKASKEKYGSASGLDSMPLHAVEESIRYLISRNTSSTKDNFEFHSEFRTTIIPELHDACDIAAVAQWIKGAENYYLQAYRDSELIPQRIFTEPDSVFMKEMLKAAQQFIPHARLRGL